MSKEVKYIRKVGDGTFLFETYEQPLRTQIKELKQQLAEKDKEIAHLKEKDNYHLRYELAGADETITNLKQQLVEKEKELAYMTKQAKKFNNEAQKYYEDAYCNSFQNQKAITELEKVKDTLKHFCNIHNDEYYGVKSQVKGIEQDVCDQIDQQIKELKGE